MWSKGVIIWEQIPELSVLDFFPSQVAYGLNEVHSGGGELLCCLAHLCLHLSNLTDLARVVPGQADELRLLMSMLGQPSHSILILPWIVRALVLQS